MFIDTASAVPRADFGIGPAPRPGSAEAGVRRRSHRRQRHHHRGPRRAQWGLTASAVCSVSVDPLLVLGCIDNRSETLRGILENRTFAINVLWETDSSVSTAFALRTPPADKFAMVDYRLENGSSVLDDALVCVTCDLYGTMPGGDHRIVVGSVTGIEVRAGEPPRPPRRTIPAAGPRSGLSALWRRCRWPCRHPRCRLPIRESRAAKRPGRA